MTETFQHRRAALLAGNLRGHGSVEAAISVNVTARDTEPPQGGIDPKPVALRPAAGRGSSWRWWLLGGLAVLFAALVVAAAVYAISNRVAARYQSSSTVRVSVQATTGISDPAVTAANDLASQFAQLASSTQVLDRAAKRLGVAGSTLEGSVTSGTIAAQNLVRISVTGSSPVQAQKRANAVAKAFVRYIDHLDAQQAALYERAVTSKLAPLAGEIAAARKRLNSPNAEVQRNATVLLSGLLSQQQTVLSSVAQASAAAQPSLQLVAAGSAGSKISPKPSLYAGIGLLATLLLLGRFLYVIGVRRSRLGQAPV